MKIKHVLTISLGVLLIVTVVTFALSIFLVWNINQKVAIQEEFLNIEQDLLDISLEQDYLHLDMAQSSEVFANDRGEQAQVLFSEIDRLYDRITNLAKSQEFFAQKYSQQFWQVEQSARLYKDQTEELVASFERVGKKDTGLIGQMRSHAHTIETTIDADRLYVYDYDLNESEVVFTEAKFELLYYLMQARRAEKDYILRVDDSYIEKFHFFLDKLNARSAQSLPAEEYETISVEINQYSTSFDTLVDEYTKLYGDESLFTSQVDAFAQVNSGVASTIYAIRSDITGTSRQVLFIISMYAAIVIFLQILAIIIIVRAIGNPVNDLLEKIKSADEEESLSDVKLPSKSEFSILVDEYNRLIGQIKKHKQEVLAIEHKKNVELAKVNDQLREKIDETYTMQIKAIEDYFKNPSQYATLVEKIKRKNEGK